jgi:hypothetical protein
MSSSTARCTLASTNAWAIAAGKGLSPAAQTSCLRHPWQLPWHPRKRHYSRPWGCRATGRSASVPVLRRRDGAEGRRGERPGSLSTKPQPWRLQVANRVDQVVGPIG